MSLQLVDLGAIFGLLSLFAGFLRWVMATEMKAVHQRFDQQDKEMNRRFDRQDGDMAELRSDVGELQTNMAVVKNDLSHVKNGLGHLRSRWDRMDDNIVQIMRDLGKLEGEQRSSSPKEKIGAGG